LNAVVTEGQQQKPRPRDMVHVYLKKSRVQILTEGFVGRRRQLLQSLRALKHDPDKIGALLLGMGGLGKSCLAGKLSERFTDHTSIIIHGKFNTITLGCGEEKTASEQGGRLVKHLRDRSAFLESRRVGQWILAKKKQELSGEHDSFLLNELASGGKKPFRERVS
jgi:hypothetical protein